MNASQELAVLLVEDRESDAELEALALERAGYHVRLRRVHDGDGMALALREDHWDVVLCDHVLLHFDALAAVGVLGANGSDIPLIVVSGTVGEEAAAAAIRDGAADFVSKDHLSRLAGVVRTQLRDAELQACQRRAEAQFRGAFDDAPFGSALIALGGGPNAGRVLRVNRALCEATGQAHDALLGVLVQDLLHPDEQLSFESELNAVLEGRKRIYRTEARLVTAAGRESWVLFSVSYVPAPGRQDAVAHFVDIDGRKRVEDALQLAHSQALEASRMKSEFVVNMSHELRTPLNGVVGLAGLLADTSLTSAQGAYVAGIRSSGQALMGVIGGILDFSKIEAGTLTIEPSDFEPAEVVGEVCVLLAPAIAEKGLALVASVDAAVPDLAYADSGPIRQVLTNLAGNAVKFTDSGEIFIRLRLGRGNANHLRFDVTDAGPGIEAGARPFEPFWQADSSMTRHHGGTGLGLAIAQRMVELMGGRLRYERAPGGGSHFWFTIPFEEARSTQAAVADLVGVRVLVADDDANRRVILERQLGSLGLRVTVVDGGEAALAELCSGADHGDPYRIAAVDRLMSAVDGKALPAAIKMASSRYATRVLLLTATPPSPPTWASEIGADGNVCEPLARSRVAVEVARVLGLRRAVPAAHAPGGRGRLLLAEDDAINQLFAFDLLKRDGWEVEVAEDGAQAVDLAAAGSYDAILMDCQMPKVDGYSATEQIRRLEGSEFHTPIIAVTAHATAYDRQRCLVAGMDGYVAKPFTTAELDDALQSELGRPERQRTPRRSAPQDQRAPERRPSAILDTRKLAHTDAAVRAQLVDMFIDSSRERIAALGEAEAAGDTETVKALAHTLKGASATIGAQRMDQACDRLGKAVARGRGDQISARHSDLERAFALTEAALTEGNRKAAT